MSNGMSFATAFSLAITPLLADKAEATQDQVDSTLHALENLPTATNALQLIAVQMAKLVISFQQRALELNTQLACQVALNDEDNPADDINLLKAHRIRDTGVQVCVSGIQHMRRLLTTIQGNLRQLDMYPQANIRPLVLQYDQAIRAVAGAVAADNHLRMVCNQLADHLEDPATWGQKS